MIDAPSRIVVAGGMGLAVDVIRLLHRRHMKPVLLIGYDDSLSHRSNYAPLQPVAAELAVPLINTRDINSASVLESVRDKAADWIIIAGWSQLVSADFLKAPRYGVLGFHMSRLPEGRGRAPVSWTLIKGLDAAWVTLQRLKPGVDDGDIIDQRSVPVDDFDDAATVCEKVNKLACDSLDLLLPNLTAGNIRAQPQNDADASYWPKRRPEDGEIDWRQSARTVFNFIRGVTSPFPGAFTYLNDKRIYVWSSSILPLEPVEEAGTILGPYVKSGRPDEAGIIVSATDGILVFRDIGGDEAAHMDSRDMIEFATQHTGQKFTAYGTLGNMMNPPPPPTT